MEQRAVLVTGATGFVGSHIAAALEGAGWRVRCAVRAQSDLRWLEGLRAERVRLVLPPGPGDGAALDAALDGAAAVVHAAGLTRARDPSDYARVNADGTGALARAAAGAGVRRFVLVGSLAARGPDAPDGGPPEPEAPISAYGRSKRDAEDRLAEAAAASRGSLEAVVLRPGGVYGPRDRDLLPLFRLASLGVIPVPRGRDALQPVYVADVAEAVLCAAEGRGGFGPYPIAGREVVGWAEVAAGLARALGRRVRAVPVPAAALVAAAGAAEIAARLLGRTPALDRRRAEDLARHRWTCDPTPAETDLGWRAELTLEEGLTRTARWYREVGWLAAA